MQLVNELLFAPGHFNSQVVLAKHEPMDRLYALKIVLKKPGRTSKLKMEAEILEMLSTHKHRLIVEYFGAFQTNVKLLNFIAVLIGFFF